MLVTIANFVASTHKDEFEKVLSLRGRKQPYFTKNSRELRSPKKINNTDIYVETHFSADMIVELSKRIIRLFGYKEDDLSIEAK